jgi:hypothetical protein
MVLLFGTGAGAFDHPTAYFFSQKTRFAPSCHGTRGRGALLSAATTVEKAVLQQAAGARAGAISALVRSGHARYAHGDKSSVGADALSGRIENLSPNAHWTEFRTSSGNPQIAGIASDFWFAVRIMVLASQPRPLSP